jgi:predicted nuclease of predicted toxin-antitoxin system
MKADYSTNFRDLSRAKSSIIGMGSAFTKWDTVALRFYFDTHIARATADQLRVRGVEVIRCEEVAMAEASDEEHLAYATREGCIVVSQDEDFVALDARWHHSGRKHGGIMKVPEHLQGSAQISTVVRELLFYTEAEQNGAVIYETEIASCVIYL